VFVRKKVVRRHGREYVYQDVVRSVRVKGKPRQERLASLGRIVESLDEGQKNELLRVVAKWAGLPVPGQASPSGPTMPAQHGPDPLIGDCRNYGDVVAVENAWEAVGLGRILRDVGREAGLGFDVERAIFAMVANRLIDPRSKYGTAEWLFRDVYLPTGTPLDADELYLALTWLARKQSDVEVGVYQSLVASKRIDATAVFYDTSAVWFEGRGPEGLAERGRPKGTHPPNRRLILLGLVRSLNGWPIAHRIFPGNAADVETVKPMLRDLVERFGVRRFIFICDRGMISEKVIRFFEDELKVDYIIATKLRTEAEVRDSVLGRAGRFREIDEQLGVKEVYCEGRRYVVCRNPVEVEADARRREEIIETLKKKHLDRPCGATTKRAKKLVTSASFGRYLTEKKGFVVLDQDKVQRDARYDGKWVLRTNLPAVRVPKEEVARLYKLEGGIEHDFREIKTFFELRPIYHRIEPRVRAHVFVCVLAKVVARELETRLHRSGFIGTSTDAVLKELGHVQVVEVGQGDERRYVRARLQPAQEDLFRRLSIDPASLPWRLPLYPIERPRKTRLDNVQAERRRQARKRARHEAWLLTRQARRKRSVDT